MTLHLNCNFLKSLNQIFRTKSKGKTRLGQELLYYFFDKKRTSVFSYYSY